MGELIQNQYTPDYVSPPGETLEEVLEEHKMSQAELAKRMGRPRKTISEIINGKAAITPDTALQLERVLGIPASFWNNRERHYREHLARQEEQERLSKQVEWLDRMPVKEMIKRQWVRFYKDPVEQLREMLNFFGIASPEQWQTALGGADVYFLKSYAFESDPHAVAAWLRRGAIEADQINCAAYNANKFKETLQQVRALTIEPTEIFKLEMVRLCAEAGVAVVFLPELPKTRTCGATQWLNSDRALIQLSLRYKTDDHFWFAFFHEAGHILRHGKRGVFIEFKDKEKNKEELEADAFAADILIPSAEFKQFLASGQYRSKAGIQQFAAEIGIAPGIVVGRLQHEGKLPHNYFYELRRKLKWVE